MRQKVAIFGSTGSIGKNTLSVIESLSDRFEVAALTAHTSFELLSEQIDKYKPAFAALTDSTNLDSLKALLKGRDTEIIESGTPLIDICSFKNIDIAVFATTGVLALPAIFTAIRNKKKVCVANKEPLVMAGELIMKAVAEYGTPFLPVDSEHSAIFQCMQANSYKEVNRIIITGSGGPFRQRDISTLESVTPAEATAHPRWKMGKKISVDSATMMNKALELVEARWLFGVSPDKLQVLIHPEAAVHSMVEFVDGAVIAQIGACDMRLPIQYALTYPERLKSPCEFVDFAKIGKFTFNAPDTARFPSLVLAKEALEKAGSFPCVMNAANEVAVEGFLQEKISFTDITRVIKSVMDKHETSSASDLDALLKIDLWARKQASAEISAVTSCK